MAKINESYIVSHEETTCAPVQTGVNVRSPPFRSTDDGLGDGRDFTLLNYHFYGRFSLEKQN